MRKHLISFAQVIKILQNIKLKGGFNPEPLPLRTPLLFIQGRWRPGQETSLTPPCSNLRSFGSKCVVEESTCDIVVTFRHPRSHRRPHSDSVPMEFSPPLHPFVTPLTTTLVFDMQSISLLCACAHGVKSEI